jgi:16S rRNA (cytosine967-C5)-methyltransferase
VRLNFPAWLEEMLGSIFGSRLGAEMTAMNGSAPLDLRVNQLKSNRADARKSLAAEGVTATPTPFAPTGLRVHERIPLSTLDAFKSGAIEVQDEGSQLAALMARAKPGMRVVDFCAGAGGKTLALAAEMHNRGHLVACDISEARLQRSGQRLRRAGVSNVERRALTTERDKWVKHHAESFDRVFVDAPCTGTGTWRRNPDAKWRLTPKDLEELTALQARILDSAARLVKPGGRLIYATCSLLPPENDLQIEQFLAGHAEFALVPIGSVWQEAVGQPCPEPEAMLHLTPARHGTDGFFVAVLERRAAAETADAA